MDPLVHLELDLRRGVDPIAGWLEATPGVRVPFTGYLEFLALLERILSDTEVPS